MKLGYAQHDHDLGIITLSVTRAEMTEGLQDARDLALFDACGGSTSGILLALSIVAQRLESARAVRG